MNNSLSENLARAGLSYEKREIDGGTNWVITAGGDDYVSICCMWGGRIDVVHGTSVLYTGRDPGCAARAVADYFNGRVS